MLLPKIRLVKVEYFESNGVTQTNCTEVRDWDAEQFSWNTKPKTER